MKLLFLGGTSFVGRHMVEVAIARGHEVTLFNRGRHPEVFPEVEQIHGDRDGGLGALAGRDWQAVIDTSGYVPRLVRDAAERLAGHVGLYCFISTISVYADPQPKVDEQAPLKTLDDPTVEVVSKDTYGGLKVLCEQAVEALHPTRHLIIRPGIIAGPHDPTDRFTYWAKQMASGGRVIAPLPADAPVQVIDARDLAAWTIRMVEQRATGIFNAVGPAEPVTRASFLAALTPPGAGTRITWLDEAALAAEGLEAGQVFPFYTAPEDAGLLAVDGTQAYRAGLQLRPLAETARDTLAWLEQEPSRPLKYALDPALEARLSRTLE